MAPSVAWVDAETVGFERDEVYLARVPDGRPLVLSGTAAVIWSLGAGDDRRRHRRADRRRRGLSAGEIEPDVADFLGGSPAWGWCRARSPDPPADGA